MVETENEEAIAALDAAIRQAERAEPVAWHVVDAAGDLMHAASWREAAHEHINDAINMHDLVEAAQWRVVPVYAAPVAKTVHQPVHQPVHGWTDADADAARLALELECILTDKDQPMPSVSRWWDSAHEALELHRQRMAEPPTESMDRRAATARPAPAQADLSASGPPITEDDLRAMLPESTVKKRYFSEAGNLLAYPVWTEQQMLDYGRAIARRCGGMK